MSDVHIQIGQIIREYRIKANMTQIQLSEALGHETSQFVSLFERGHSKVPLETLGQLVKILQIPEAKIKKLLLQDFEAELESRISAGKKKKLQQSS